MERWKADKSTNFYKLETTKYNQLLNGNITKTYKKAEKIQLNEINDKAKTITEKLQIDDRVETTATKEAFITLKDHKGNFENKPACRLINPSKQEIGKISKQILDNINKKLLSVMKVNQWKNTSSVLQWFKNLPNKRKSAFISFDVVEFYPSISETLLKRALDFAANYVTIPSDDRHIILQAKQSLLFKKRKPLAEEKHRHALRRHRSRKQKWRSRNMWISRNLHPFAAKRNTLRHGNWALQRWRLSSSWPNPTKNRKY